jgi:hypothetical protein
MGAPVMKKIAACAVMTLLGSTGVFRGLVAHARAAEQQWSELLPDHTAIPEKFGAPIRERFSEADTVRPPGAQMPVPTPGREVTPSLTEPKSEQHAARRLGATKSRFEYTLPDVSEFI